MISFFQEMFSFPFMTRAFLVGTLIALCSALLGVTLVLKRYSMIGTGLSNVGFASLALAKVFNVAPLIISTPVLMISSFLLLRVNENSKLKGDSAIALISTAALAFGIFLISVTTGLNTDVCNYLFGTILSMTKMDVNLSVAISIIVLILFILFYNKIFAVSFDESFAQSIGINVSLYNSLIALLTSLLVVVGMRMMGSLLITSLIVLPALSSMRLCKRFKSVIILSGIISVICLWGGLIISYVYATPTGASIVFFNLIVFGIFTIISKMRNIYHEK